MKFVIEGGKQLRGEIRVSGAKNAALKMIAASLLFDDRLILKNTPDIIDVENMLKIANKLGRKSQRTHDVVEIRADAKSSTSPELPPTLAGALRGAIVFMGALLSQYGKAVLPVPGGCSIGKRPITAHIDIFSKLGIRTTKNGDNYLFEKVKDPQPKARLIEQSVTATENAILYLCRSKYNALLQNCALEPEIDDLMAMLSKAGAKIRRVGKDCINVIGVESLSPVTHRIVGDRIEAGTWMVAGLLLGNPLKISGFNPETIRVPIEIARKMGGTIDVEQDAIRVKKSITLASRITTEVYPDFPTDLQSPFGLLLTQCKGKSVIKENLFNDRLKYLDELKLMGAKVKDINVHESTILGPTPLTGKHIHSTDLRAGATMVLAGLIAEGKTTVDNAEIIDRGYEDMDDKLRNVGASITRR